jgi:Nif-specific regulatory protein
VKGRHHPVGQLFHREIRQEVDKKIVSISVPATDMLMQYHWPGNVRELENCIERAIILCTDGVIRTHHLPPNLQKSDDSPIQELKGTLQDMLISRKGDDYRCIETLPR